MLTFCLFTTTKYANFKQKKKKIAHLKATWILSNFQLPGKANASFCCDIDDIVGYAQFTLTII